MSETAPPDLLRSGSLETITFYVDLEPDTKANLEVVARASLAFASAVREISFVLDPSLDIRIELVSGTEGSLSLNSLLRFFGREDATARQNVKIIALAMAGFFSVQTVEWTYDQIMDHFFKPEDVVNFSPKQIEQIAEKAAEAVARRVGAPQVERVYRELQTDPAVRGVTVTPSRHVERSRIVPRSEFRGSFHNYPWLRWFGGPLCRAGAYLWPLAGGDGSGLQDIGPGRDGDRVLRGAT